MKCVLMSIFQPPYGKGGGRITRVYLAPFMVSYNIIIFCMKKHGRIDINGSMDGDHCIRES